MVERDDYKYVPKNKWGKNEFEQQVGHAYRWAVRSGQEVVDFSDEIYNQAMESLGPEVVENLGNDPTAVALEAVRGYLITKRLGGVEARLVVSNREDGVIRPVDIKVILVQAQAAGNSSLS